MTFFLNCYTLYYIVRCLCGSSSLLLFGWGDPPDSSTLGGMTVPKDDKLKDYARYAEHCLNVRQGIGNCVAFNAKWLPNG